MRHRLLLCALPVLLCAPHPSFAGEPRPPGDDTVVAFVCPGSFAEARQRASEERRPLLVKGVAFGMDEAGATTPTRGHW